MITKGTTLTVTRIFHAPREKVWKAWTEPEQMKHWWGPKDYTAPHIEIDPRAGGKYLYCMRGNMGPGTPVQDFWSGGEFKEVIPMEKIVATDFFTDKTGRKISPKDVGMPGEWPDEMLVTVTFEDAGPSKTKLTVVHVGHPVEMTKMAEMGWQQSLDKFEAIL